MRTLTIPVYRPPAPERPPTRGRWIWIVSGLATAGLLAWPLVGLITNAGNGGQEQFAYPTPLITRTITVGQPVTSLSVESYGGPIQITAGAVRHVTVTEAISFGSPGQAPRVTAAVSDRKLTLGAPDCVNTGCSIGFTVTVPTGVSVTAESEGGNIAVTGATGANLDSGGGTVQANQIDGPLSVTSEDAGISVSGVTAPSGTNLDSGGGPVQASHVDGPLTISSEDGGITLSDVTSPGVNLDSGGGYIQAGRVTAPLTLISEDGSVTLNGLTGDLNADTGGGPLSGTVASGRASVQTEDGSAALTFSTAPGYVYVDTGGGPAQLTFDRPPTAVMVSTEDGSASLSVPGGPYAVTAESEGGSVTVGVPTSSAAQRSLTVSTGGGPLEIVPR